MRAVPSSPAAEAASRSSRPRRTWPIWPNGPWRLWPPAVPPGRCGTSGPRSSACSAPRCPFLPPERHRETRRRGHRARRLPRATRCRCEAPALLDEPPELRRSDGESVFTEHGAGRYTSQAVLDAETRLVNATRTPTAAGLSGPSAAAALDGFEAVARTSLDAGQRGLVTAFACDSRLLLAGIGPGRVGEDDRDARPGARAPRRAGSGSSRSPRPPPRPTCSAASSACGRRTCTSSCTNGPPGRPPPGSAPGPAVPEPARMFRLGPGDVVLVDEAGMAGTLLLDQLVQIAAARGAVVRLLGDDRQLPAVEGGGALRLVAAAARHPAADRRCTGSATPPRPPRRCSCAPGTPPPSTGTASTAASGPGPARRWPRPPTPAGRTTCSPGRSP